MLKQYAVQISDNSKNDVLMNISVKLTDYNNWRNLRFNSWWLIEYCLEQVRTFKLGKVLVEEGCMIDVLIHNTIRWLSWYSLQYTLLFNWMQWTSDNHYWRGDDMLWWCRTIKSNMNTTWRTQEDMIKNLYCWWQWSLSSGKSTEDMC